MSTCLEPSFGVLFDENIPTLTGLDGNAWASQLLTIHSRLAVLGFNFTGAPNFVGVRRIEIVLFNCVKWGISVQSITLQTSTGFAGTTNPTVTSCDSLVRVCIGDLSTNSAQRELILSFIPNDWVHIAEVTFYGAGPTCPPETILTTTTNTTAATSGLGTKTSSYHLNGSACEIFSYSSQAMCHALFTQLCFQK